MLSHSLNAWGFFFLVASTNALVVERAAQPLICTKGVSFVLNASFSFEQWQRSSNPVVIADLDGDHIDELINIDAQGQISDYSTGSEHKLGSLARAPVSAPRALVRFADLDAHGKQDYIVLNETTGSVKAWINNGPGSFIPWTSLGEILTIGKGFGGPAAGVRFGDFDGDGKDDYIYVHTDGSVDAWINKGYTGGPSNGFFGTSASAPSTLKWNWMYYGRTFRNAGPQAESRFADINGDGLDDYLIVDAKNGSVTVWQNNGFLKQSFGIWNFPEAGIIKGYGYAGSQVHIGPFSGTNRSDYVVVPSSGSPVLYQNTCKK